MIVVLLLGGAGVYVAYLLQRAAVPTAPTSIPRAADWYGGQSCNVSFAIAAEATPTPACRVSCTTEGTESGNYKCEGGVWRNKTCSTTDDSSCVCPATVTETPPAACRGACSSSVACDTGMTCVGGVCRNSTCSTTDDSSCVCPTTGTGTVTTTVTQTVAPTGTGTVAPTEEVTATPTEEILYETGVLNLPGAAAFGGGLLLVVLGILFAL